MSYIITEMSHLVDTNQNRHAIECIRSIILIIDINATRKTIVIERPNKTVETVSPDRVTWAPSQRTADEIQDVIRPMTYNELGAGSYPVNEQINIRDLSETSRGRRNNPQQP